MESKKSVLEVGVFVLDYRRTPKLKIGQAIVQLVVGRAVGFQDWWCEGSFK